MVEVDENRGAVPVIVEDKHFFYMTIYLCIVHVLIAFISALVRYTETDFMVMLFHALAMVPVVSLVFIDLAAVSLAPLVHFITGKWKSAAKEHQNEQRNVAETALASTVESLLSVEKAEEESTLAPSTQEIPASEGRTIPLRRAKMKGRATKKSE